MGRPYEGIAIGFVTDSSTSYRMRQVRTSDTKPELTVRSLLRELGHHYRLNNGDLPGRPDLANRTHKWAVFVNGCFWHGHLDCSRAKLPKRNWEYWMRKIRRNQDRDRRAILELRALGFRVVTIWECELSSIPTVKARLRQQLG